MLLVQRGERARAIRVSDEQFTEVLDNIKKDNKIESEEQFQAALKQEKMTLAELRTISKRMLIGQVQQNEIVGRVGVTEDEERAYYDAHPASSRRRPASRCARSSSTCRARSGRRRQASARRRGREKGRRASGRASPKGEIREARGRGVRRAVEGQRRPDRAHLRDEMNDELRKLIGR